MEPQRERQGNAGSMLQLWTSWTPGQTVHTAIKERKRKRNKGDMLDMWRDRTQIIGMCKRKRIES